MVTEKVNLLSAGEKKKLKELGTKVHVCNTSTQESKAGRSKMIEGQFGLHRETVRRKGRTRRKKERKMGKGAGGKKGNRMNE